MTDSVAYTLNRHDGPNEVSARIEVHMTKPYMRARARKLVELLVQDLDGEMFEDE